jgi:transposase
MSSISRRETGYNERDLRIAVAIGAGMTMDAAAEFACVSRATVYNRQAANRDFIDLAVAIVKAATSVSLAQSLEQAKLRWAASHGDAQNKIIELVESEDDQIALKAATIVVDRNEGKATQKIEQKIEQRSISVEAVVQIPADDVAFLMRALSGTSKLLGPAREEEPAPEPDYIIEDSDSEPVSREHASGARAA